MFCLILGDPHIGKSLSLGKNGLGSLLNSRVIDQLNLLDWTLDQAIEHEVEHIIITGDVFEEPKPAPYLITLFISWLKKCLLNQIKVHIIMGNHDLIRSGNNFTSSLDIISEADFENIYIYKDIDTIFIGQSAFTLVPFRDRKSFMVESNSEALTILSNAISYELNSIPPTCQKIIVGHLAIEGSIPVGDEIDEITNELFCPISMFAGYDRGWFGHVHKPQVMSKIPYISHIGSMDISNFGETDQKKHIIIIDCQNFSFKELGLPTRDLRKINIVVPSETLDSTEFILSELEKIDLNRSIVKVDIQLTSPDLKSTKKSIVEKYLINRGVFNVVGIFESRKSVMIKKSDNEEVSKLDTKIDVVSALKTYSHNFLEKKMQNKFMDLSLEIYTAFKNEEKI